MYKIYIFMQKKLIRILARALHEYVNFVHDPEKQYRSLSACWNTGVYYRAAAGWLAWHAWLGAFALRASLAIPAWRRCLLATLL